MNPHSTSNSRSLITAISVMALVSSIANATSILVPNASFEDPNRTGLDPSYSFSNTSSPTGWTFSSGVNWGVDEVRNNRYGTIGSEGSRLDALGGDGDQLGYINIGFSGTGYAQSAVLGTVEANTIYTLTISFAQRDSGDRLPNSSFGLLVHGSQVGTFTQVVGAGIASGSIADRTYTWTAPSADDPLIGGEIRIRMDFTHSGTGWEQAQFDKVRLVLVNPTYNTWAAANGATGQTPQQDHNNDGVSNGIEYFMGQTGSSFTANPSLNAANEFSCPASAAYQGAYEVQTSPDLVNWTNVVPKPAIVSGTLSYTLPPGAPGGKSFVRLFVTPTP